MPILLKWAFDESAEGRTANRLFLAFLSTNLPFPFNRLRVLHAVLPFADVCELKVDLVFLIDSSGSILPNEYQMMKDFVSKVVQYNGLSKNGIHAGVAIFSSVGNVAIKLSDFYDTKTFISAVNALPHQRSTRSIDEGLYVLYNQLLTKDFGARVNLPKVVLILTHGKQEKASGNVDLRVGAKPLQQEDVLITAIGIGRFVDREELETITGNTETVYTVRNFNLLLEPRFTSNFDFKCDSRKSSGLSLFMPLCRC